MSNSLDPDLGPNCLLRLSADHTGRKRVKADLLCLNSNSHYFSGGSRAGWGAEGLYYLCSENRIARKKNR